MKMTSSLITDATLENLTRIHDFIEETGQKLGIDADVAVKIQLAVDEAVTNVIVHGYRRQGGTIEIELRREQADLVIQIRDEAGPFDPTLFPPADVTLPIEQRKPGGLGIHLMRQIMDEISYHPRIGGGNELTLIKRGIGKG